MTDDTRAARAAFEAWFSEFLVAKTRKNARLVIDQNFGRLVWLAAWNARPTPAATPRSGVVTICEECDCAQMLGGCVDCRAAQAAAGRSPHGPRPIAERPTHQTLTAAASLDGSRPLPFDRDTLGRMVRESWVRWAQTQPNPKPSWLVPYAELAEPDKEADRQIGEAIARWTMIGAVAAQSILQPKPSLAAATALLRAAEKPVCNSSLERTLPGAVQERAMTPRPQE